MKTLPSFPPGRGGCIMGIVNALLAIGLTVLSFRYIRPEDCYRECGAPEGMPCVTGGCGFGEQKAGWPLPAFVDDPGGGSPTGGWGLLGPEDLPLLLPVILDVLFYSALLWLALYLIQFLRRQAVPLRLIWATLPLNVLLAASLWLFYMFFAYYVPIGRGHTVSVYVDTPTGINAVSGFSPIVSIPVDEMIDNYGDPDYVWLTPGGTSEAPGIQAVLYWDSIGMFVELPRIPNKTYVVKKRTDIEMIIFFGEVKVLAIEGKPLTGERISWQGYGSYQP